MAIKKKVIVVPVRNVKKLAEVHQVTRQAVYNALKFSSNSELAQKIRREALSMYQGEYNTKVYFN